MQKKYISFFSLIIVLVLGYFTNISAQNKIHNLNKDEEVSIELIEKQTSSTIKLKENKFVQQIYNKEVDFYEILATENFHKIQNLLHGNAIIASGEGRENIENLLDVFYKNKSIKLLFYKLDEIVLIKTDKNTIILNYRIGRVFQVKDELFAVKGIATSIYSKQNKDYKIIVHHYSLIEARKVENRKTKESNDY